MTRATRKQGIALQMKSILRLQQWYKNLLVFVAVIFENLLLSRPDLVARCVVGFFSLSLVSASNYVINDYLDQERDRKVHLKRGRVPLLLGNALILSILLFSASLLIAAFLSMIFLYFIVAIAIIGQFYNFIGKRIILVDALLVSSIYVLRAFSGYILIGVPPALPNVLPIAFVALYLIFVKKRSTILILGQDAAIEQRETFRWYNLVRCRWGAVVFGSLAYFYYALWVFVTRKFPLLVGISTLFPAGLLLVAFTRYTETVPPAGIFIWRALKDWKVSTCVAILALLYMVQILIPN